MQMNPLLLAYATDLVKSASAQQAPVAQGLDKQAAEAIANNAYWDEMSKQAAVAEDLGAEELFNTAFADEFTKLAAAFAEQYDYLPPKVAALFNE